MVGFIFGIDEIANSSQDCFGSKHQKAHDCCEKHGNTRERQDEEQCIHASFYSPCDVAKCLSMPGVMANIMVQQC